MKKYNKQDLGLIYFLATEQLSKIDRATLILFVESLESLKNTTLEKIKKINN